MATIIKIIIKVIMTKISSNKNNNNNNNNNNSNTSKLTQFCAGLIFKRFVSFLLKANFL